jgi:hypothetical protein
MEVVLHFAIDFRVGAVVTKGLSFYYRNFVTFLYTEKSGIFVTFLYTEKSGIFVTKEDYIY